jgi:hypothetical protein
MPSSKKLLIAVPLLVLPWCNTAWAQSALPVQSTVPAVTAATVEQDKGDNSESTLVLGTSAAAEIRLNSVPSAAELALMAVGACPVISDLLYDMCIANPQDSSCQPGN